MTGKKNTKRPFRLVETTLGNCILPALSKAIVNLSGDVYLEKEVRDLSVGEMVLFRKEGIDKTLEEIEPHLGKSYRYREADSSLHVNQNDGRITRFRRDLISGLEGVLNCGEEFLAKLFRVDENDFSSEEYSDMTNFVSDVIKKDGRIEHEYAKGTIKDWLAGETLAPREWKVFDILADAGVSDEFRNYGKPKSEGGLREHYKLYTVVRQGIMRYLSTKGGESISREEVEREAGESIS